MEEFAIPCVRELNDYHAQVKNISASSSYHNAKLQVSRKELMSLVKSVQELHCFNTLRNCYYLKLTPVTASSIAALPFMKPGNLPVADRLVEMSNIGSIRSSINRFVKNVFNRRDELADLLITLDFNNFPKSVPYLPSYITPLDFFASSTIPSIFGHFWTVEFQENFIQFVFDVANKLPNLSPITFRAHWLFECIKYYILRSDIIHFLSLSLRDPLISAITDKNLHQLAANNQYQQFFDKLTEYANQMIQNMIESIAIFPTTFSHIMNFFVSKSNNTQDQLSWLELFFVDTLLVPAISNPVSYGIISATYNFDPHPKDGPKHAMTTLAQLFKYILRPQQFSLRYPDVDAKKITALPLINLLNQLVLIEKFDYHGPKLVDLLPLLGIHYILILMNLPDVFLLADCFQRVSNPDPQLVKDASNIPTNETVDFDYFRFDVWDFNTFGFKKPKIPENEIEKPPKNPASLTGEALYKFLSHADIDRNAPNGYSEFTTYYETNMIASRQYMTEAYLRHLYVIHQSVPEKDKRAVIPALEDEIRRHLELEQRNDDILTGIAVQTRILNETKEQLVSYSDTMYPVLYANLLHFYLQSGVTPSSDVLKPNTIISQAPEITKNKVDFSEFILKYFHQITTFITPIADFAVNGVQCCFHSYLLQVIPPAKYREYQPSLRNADEYFSNSFDLIYQTLCYKQSLNRVKPLFDNPNLLAFPIYLSQQALINGSPLNGVRMLADMNNLIIDTVELELGSRNLSEEEKQGLFDFVMIHTQSPHLYSIGKYFQQFLYQYPLRDPKVYSSEMNNALSNYLTFISSLETINSSF